MTVYVVEPRPRLGFARYAAPGIVRGDFGYPWLAAACGVSDWVGSGYVEVFVRQPWYTGLPKPPVLPFAAAGRPLVLCLRPVSYKLVVPRGFSL